MNQLDSQHAIIPCRYVEGGMGSISKAIASAAVTAGAHVVTNVEVCHQESILVSKFTPLSQEGSSVGELRDTEGVLAKRLRFQTLKTNITREFTNKLVCALKKQSHTE